jgi:glycosyltransferase involved in cell wall biosynthesis
MSAAFTAPILSVVIPAFNEEANVGPVVERTRRVLDGQAWVQGYEIIVVDDGSTDRTGEVADTLAARHHEVRVVHHRRNGGFGAAIRSGYAAAAGTYSSAIPADGEVEIEQALNLLRDNLDADLVISRRDRTVVVRREVLSRAWNGLMRLIVGFDLRGMDGIYVIRTDLVRGFTLRSNTGLVNLEILVQCARRGVLTRSGIMRASPRLSGASKVTNVRTMSKLTWEMVKLRMALMKDARK